MKRIILFIIVAFFSSITSSCISELGTYGEETIINEAELSFIPSVVSVTKDTKANDPASSPAVNAPFKAMEESGSHFLTISYSSKPAFVSGSGFEQCGIMTKGELMNHTDSEGDLKDFVKTFKVSGWHNTSTNSSSFIQAYADVTYFDSDDIWSISDPKKLTRKDNFIFYAYANSGNTANFSLSNTSKDSQSLQYVVPESASDQNDILLGDYSGNTIPDGEVSPTGKVSLRFAHPLTAVVFKLGSIENIDYVKEISISGVYSKGTVTHTPGLTFDWGSTKEGSMEVSQSKEGGLEVDAETGYIGVPFVLIPQELVEKPVTFTILVHTEDGKDVSLKAIRDVEDWAAGECNVYTIQEDDNFVEILGDLSSGIKFKNTSSSPAYIRAALVGNFYDDNNNIVSSWYGTFTSGNGWTKEADGFYYYDTPVASDNSSNPVISSFIKPTLSGADFYLNVLVQASHFPFK